MAAVGQICTLTEFGAARRLVSGGSSRADDDALLSDPSIPPAPPARDSSRLSQFPRPARSHAALSHLHIYVCASSSSALPAIGSPSPLPRAKRASPSFPLHLHLVPNSSQCSSSRERESPLPQRARDVWVPRWHPRRRRGGKDADGRPGRVLGACRSRLGRLQVCAWSVTVRTYAAVLTGHPAPSTIPTEEAK